MSETSPTNQNDDSLSFGGLWKLGKTLQARAYKQQLDQPVKMARWALDRVNGISGGSASVPGKPGVDDEVINVDSPTNIYNQYQNPPPRGGGLAKVLLGAGLIATGFGAAYGVPLILDGLKKPAPVQPAPQPGTDNDTDTRIRLDLE